MDETITAPAETPTAGTPAEAAAPEWGALADEEENDAPDGQAVPETPEGYQLTVPEDLEIDREMLTAYRAKAHELGLNQVQFDTLAQMYAEKVAGGPEAFAQAQMDQVLELERGWIKELQSGPSYQADREHAQRALARFGSRELIDYFDGTKAGSYPPMFKFVAAVGRALAEPEFRGGRAAPSAKTVAEVMYPHQGK